MSKLAQFFSTATCDPLIRQRLGGLPEPRSRYVVAITPRSGSSYLCDLMTQSGRFGRPSEILNPAFVPDIYSKMSGEGPAEYLENTIRAWRTANGLSGLKASWFQFHDFCVACGGADPFKPYRFVLLTRRNLSAQAISLFKATKTNVFHTNIRHSEEALGRLNALEYDFDGISYWYRHIVQQERGWRQFFLSVRKSPLSISYEEIEEDALEVMRRIAVHVGVEPNNVKLPEESIFRKVGDDRNVEWALRFEAERLRAGGRT